MKKVIGIVVIIIIISLILSYLLIKDTNVDENDTLIPPTASLEDNMSKDTIEKEIKQEEEIKDEIINNKLDPNLPDNINGVEDAFNFMINNQKENSN